MKLVAGEFAPDLPDHGSQGLSEAVNLFPGSAGYRPVGQFVPHTDALPAPCRGASAFVAPSGRVVFLAGTDTALYRQDGTGWTQLVIAPPVMAAPATGTTGGSLATGTYFYRVTAITALGETTVSNEVSQTTTGASSTVTLNWAKINGATGYRIYRGTASGAQNVYYVVGDVATYLDTGAAATAGTAPVTTPAFTMPAGGRWRFVQFGPIAVVSNYNDPPVKVNLETDAVALLGGSPPNMEAMAVVSNFLVGTKTNGSVTQVAWSGENNAEWWTYASRKSDFNNFPDGGEVTGIVGGEIGLILQRTAVRRMAYVGGNVLFRFDKISSNIGCASVHSVAQHGELAFWYSDNGFIMWDGASLRPIGFERVDEAFNRSYGVVNFDAMSTAIDGVRSTVIWSVGRAMWCYNWQLDKWSVVEHEAEIVTSRLTRAPSLEEQDPAVGALDDNVDGAGLITFDAARFAAGDPRFYVFTAGVLGTFAGDNMAARITGRSQELIEGRDTRIRRVRPMTDALTGMSVRIDTRQRLGDQPRRRDFTTLQASGEMPVRARGRFAKMRLRFDAGAPWTYVQGVDVTLEAAGRR